VVTERRTSISAAIDYSMALFAKSPFKSKRRVIDISGDGPNNDGDPVTGLRNRAVAAGIVINGLPIINDRPSPWGMLPMPNLDLYYEDCVIGGNGAFLLVANSFQDFGRAIRRKLILEIAGLQPDPEPRAGVMLASTRERPPCNAGERRSPRIGDEL
jgi:hypothetical protein